MLSKLRPVVDLAVFFLFGGVRAARRKGVTVGKRCRIYVRSFGSEPFLVSIGDDVTITSGVRILTHDGSTGLVRNGGGRRYQRFAPVTIGSRVFIGVNSIVMPGVTIGSDVVVGAGSVVTRDVPDGAVVAGNPARPITDFQTFRARIERTCANDEDLDDAGSYRERVERAMAIGQSRSGG